MSVGMSDIFWSEIQKHKFVYGVMLSLFSSILLVITTLEFADRLLQDWVWLPITSILFISLFWWYVNLKAKED